MTILAWTRRRLIGALILTLALARTALAAEPATLLFYEAVPSAQIDLPRIRNATYNDKETLAKAVAKELVPDILQTLGFDPKRAKTVVAPGGYELQTNPSLQTTISASAQQADRLACAFGYVLRQGGILVADRGDKQGKAYQVTVRFQPRLLTRGSAHSFYLHAAAADLGLSGGYSVIGDDMLFINLRGAAGKPLGGLDDHRFLTGLQRAVAVFPGASIAASGKLRAYLVENDWAIARDGETFATRLGGTVHQLDGLRQRHTMMVEAAANLYDWR